MGSFAQHLGASVAAGAAFGAASHYYFHTPPDVSFCVGLLSLSSGFLADLDSPDSHESHHALNIAAAVVPAIIVTNLNTSLFNATRIFLITTISFLFIRTIVREVTRHIGAHRGMFHSIPAVVVWGLSIYLSFRTVEQQYRTMYAWSAGLGYLVHLLVDTVIPDTTISKDEFNPVRHSGSALKFHSSSLFANFICYGLLLVLSFLFAREAGYFSF